MEPEATAKCTDFKQVSDYSHFQNPGLWYQVFLPQRLVDLMPEVFGDDIIKAIDTLYGRADALVWNLEDCRDFTQLDSVLQKIRGRIALEETFDMIQRIDKFFP